MTFKKTAKKDSSNYTKSITESGLTIYDEIEIGHPLLWITSPDLESILNSSLKDMPLDGLPLRTRSKIVKEKICSSLGYPIPKSFKKTQPRFPGQLFDVYIQKSNNLQIWNEELSASRRYVLIKVDENNLIEVVKVVTGDTLAILDTTGTLTQKYQARLSLGPDISELISNTDTERIQSILESQHQGHTLDNPTDYPDEKTLISIEVIFDKLKSIIGESFIDAGSDQERNRGAALHELVCHALGYKSYQDNGRFPDVLNQLLEVKLQTSPTIDLGLVTPNSDEVLDIPQIFDKQVRHCDVRYVIFYANIDSGMVHISNMFLVTGQDFFSRFPRFEGKVLNKKIQIPLPVNFFYNNPKTE